MTELKFFILEFNFLNCKDMGLSMGEEIFEVGVCNCFGDAKIEEVLKSIRKTVELIFHSRSSIGVGVVGLRRMDTFLVVVSADFWFVSL